MFEKHMQSIILFKNSNISHFQETMTMLSTTNVRDFGAIGDGITKDTQAIQAAINAGDLVVFPAGTYLTGTIYLHDNCTLDIHPGAVILASPDLEDYNAADFAPQNHASKSEVTSGGHLIIAMECKNVSIRGGGVIDGNHSAFLNTPSDKPPCMFEVNMRPAQMLFFCECFNVRICDVELRNSPYWTCLLHGCEEVTVRGLHIFTHPKLINGDGIDIDCCQKVTVSDCIINTSDDCITLRGDCALLKNKKPCQHITISNCVLTSFFANTIRVGVGSGEVHDATFSNIVITGYRTAISIVSNWSQDPAHCKGVDISDISFNGIHTSARRFLALKLDNVPGPAKTPTSIRNISFSNVRGTMELNSEIRGNGVGTVSGIILEDVRLLNKGKGIAGEFDFKGAWGHRSTDASIEIINATDVEIQNSRISYPEDSTGWVCDCRLTNAKATFFNSPMKTLE